MKFAYLSRHYFAQNSDLIMERIIVAYVIISICTSINALVIPELAAVAENIAQKNTSCDVTLDFSNMDLSVLKTNFISNPSVKTLVLRNNDIKIFQENTFDSLPSLENLDLSHNRLIAENLFSFGSLSVLKSLTLDNNPKITHNEMIYNFCMNNQYLSDNYCKYYSTLTVKYDYPQLTRLSIRNIFIASLASDWADHFPNLTHLDISQNYLRQTSGEVFSRLPASVISLTMKKVEFKTLDVSELKNIIDLDLSENKFDTLSSHYCHENTLCLRNPNLESLRIVDCSIKNIERDAFKDIKKLNYLDISGNDFEQILHGTFEFIPSLSHLDLSRNKLNSIPDFSNLKNLTSLYMDNIYKKELLSSTALGTFLELPTLKVLSLRSNGLATIPSSFLKKLPKLSELYLNDNKITALPYWQWQNNLRVLSLRDNEITSLENISLKDAQSLEVLDIKNNKFSVITLKYIKHLQDYTKIIF